MKKRKLWKILLLAVGLPVLLVSFLAFAGLTNTFTPQWIMDRVVVASFQPSPEISRLVDGSGMGERGEFYFFTGTPELNNSADFNRNCADVINEQSIVLGCYTGRIFIFDVTDERIAGVRYVTAAHEMLHAAYDRLGILEKIRINNLLDQQLSQTTDQRILDLVAIYDELEPGHRLNELHSIFGSEVRDLSSELAEYYTRYFSNRDLSVAAAEKYEEVFIKMEQRATELEAQLSSLGQEIEELSAVYDRDFVQLNRDIDYFNNRTFYDEAEFYAQRNTLLYRQAQLNARADSINAKIEQYNQYIEELQALGRDAEQLQNNINSQADLQ